MAAKSKISTDVKTQVVVFVHYILTQYPEW
jgi:hypothetical protein